MGSGIASFMHRQEEEDDAPPILDSYLNRSNFINSTETPNPEGGFNYNGEEFMTPGMTPRMGAPNEETFMPEHFFQHNVTSLDSSLSLVYSYYEKTVKLGKLVKMGILAR